MRGCDWFGWGVDPGNPRPLVTVRLVILRMETEEPGRVGHGRPLEGGQKRRSSVRQTNGQGWPLKAGWQQWKASMLLTRPPEKES